MPPATCSANTVIATCACRSSRRRRYSSAAIGAVTDVVEHEMYTFEDKLNGESLTLRPEATAGIVRAAIEHNLTYERAQRVWTAGPMFRHERPQRGRYRQFHQFDVEALGFAGPDVDAEQIVLLARLWRRLGLDGRRHAADQLDRRPARAPAASRGADRAFQQARRRCSTTIRSADCTPIRCASSTARIRRCRDVVASAPKLIEFIAARFARALRRLLQALLADAGIAFEIDATPRARPRLLQPHRVRVGDRSPRRAGHGGRRRPLRRAVRAAGRQADARLRLRDRHRAHGPPASGRRDAACRPRLSPTSCT